MKNRKLQVYRRKRKEDFAAWCRLHPDVDEAWCIKAYHRLDELLKDQSEYWNWANHKNPFTWRITIKDLD